jgi:hypothetical protein
LNLGIRDENDRFIDEAPTKPNWRSRAGTLILAALALALVVWVMDMTLNLL